MELAPVVTSPEASLVLLQAKVNGVALKLGPVRRRRLDRDVQ
jgi:hypothetical protein